MPISHYAYESFIQTYCPTHCSIDYNDAHGSFASRATVTVALDKDMFDNMIRELVRVKEEARIRSWNNAAHLAYSQYQLILDLTSTQGAL